MKMYEEGKARPRGCLGVGLTVAVLALVSHCNAKDTNCRLQPPQASVDQLDDEIVRLVSTLQWSTATLVFEDSSGNLPSLTDQLNGLNVPTMILYVHTVLAHDCGELINGGFVVVGSFDFVKHVFNQVAECAEKTHHGGALFTSEWLTVIKEDDIQPSVSVFSAFENVAVVVISKTGILSLWTLQHVGDDSKLSVVTSLPPDVIPLTRQHILPNPSYGLGGRTLRIVTKVSAFIVMHTDKDDPVPYQGVAIEILEELSMRLNFSYIFVPAADDSWGMQMPNGQWSGPIGTLTRKEADMAVSALTVTKERSAVADATTPFLHNNAVIIFKKGGKALQDPWTFFLRPFQSSVYHVVGTCVVLVLLLLVLLERCEQGLVARAKAAMTAEMTWQVIVGNLEILLGGLLSRSTASESASRAGRVLMMTWLLLGLILTSAYSSQLTSSLTVRYEALPFTSLAEMLGQTKYTWGFFGSGSTASLLKTSTDRQLRQLYQGALGFAESDPSVVSNDDNLQMAKVVQGKYAFLTANSLRYDVLAADHCDVAKLPDVNIASTFGFYLQKASPYTRLVSEQINKMLDSGLIHHWRRKWAPEKAHCDPDDAQDERVIGLDDTQSAFYLATIGLVVAAVALGLEKIVLMYLSHRTQERFVTVNLEASMLTGYRMKTRVTELWALATFQLPSFMVAIVLKLSAFVLRIEYSPEQLG